jgi:hypothetical protein
MQISMNLFHHNKYVCEYGDGKEFETYEDLVAHERHVHHHPIVMYRNKDKFDSVLSQLA